MHISLFTFYSESEAQTGTTHTPCEIVIQENKTWNMTCHMFRCFQVLTGKDIFSQVVSSSKVPLPQRVGKLWQAITAHYKSRMQNNWKCIPTNSKSLFLNCFGLEWSTAKKRGLEVGWRESQGWKERGSATTDNRIMGSLSDVGAYNDFWQKMP